MRIAFFKQSGFRELPAAALLSAVFFSLAAGRTTQNINMNWKFIFNSDNTSYAQTTYSDASWQSVCLPHTFQYNNHIINGNEWWGVCWYRKSFNVDASAAGKKVFLRFEGAMSQATVYVNGTQVGTHVGGYVPFTIDVTNNVTAGASNILAMRLDNTPRDTVPPYSGFTIDYMMFGGIYRDVYLIISDMLYVPDPVQPAGQPSGGSFIRTPTVSTSSASLLIKTRVKNDYAVAKTCVLKTTILSPANAVVATISTTQSIAAGASYLFVQNGTVSSPTLWSVANPARYTAVSEVSDNTTPVDTFTERFGIRSILFNTNGFFLNGTNVKLFGVNRHQMYPYIGGALPDNGQRREALLLKTMGCNYIRLSHYPQAPAFMDALDSLGIMAWEEVPTWQGGAVNTAWINRHHQNIIDMIRRDRNHPCILIWGVGINEGVDDQTFEGGCQAVAKSEDSTHYTSHGKNWNDPSDIAFDIYGGNRFYPNELPGSAASEGIGTGNLVGYVNSEYVGHTFTTGRFNPAHHQINQTARFEQQVTADRNAAWIAGGTGWCAFDYNSRAGWAASGVTIDGDNVPGQGISYHGVCDIFRIPKFSYYFHQAQSASDNYSGSVHPMVFIESFGDYAMPSTQTIKVQSNCDQVELFVNGVSLGTKSPDTQTPAVDGIPATTTNLAHPPFTFTNVAYSSPGTIRADGKIGGVVKATQTVYAQGTAAKIVLIPDADTVYADGADIVRVVVQVVDANNQVVNASTATVNVAASGAGKVICGSAGPVASGSVTLEAGQLAFLVQAGTSAGTIAVTATSGSLTQTQHTFVVPGQSVGVREPRLIPVSLDVAAMPAIRMEGRKIVFENLDMKIPSRIMLVSMDGRIAKALTSTGKTSAVFPVSLFPAGVYTAIVEVGSKNVRKNVVVLK